MMNKLIGCLKWFRQGRMPRCTECGVATSEAGICSWCSGIPTNTYSSATVFRYTSR